MVDDKYYEQYNPGQGIEQNRGITPEDYEAWKKKQKTTKSGKEKKAPGKKK